MSVDEQGNMFADIDYGVLDIGDEMDIFHEFDDSMAANVHNINSSLVTQDNDSSNAPLSSLRATVADTTSSSSPPTPDQDNTSRNWNTMHMDGSNAAPLSFQLAATTNLLTSPSSTPQQMATSDAEPRAQEERDAVEPANEDFKIEPHLHNYSYPELPVSQPLSTMPDFKSEPLYANAEMPATDAAAEDEDDEELQPQQQEDVVREPDQLLLDSFNMDHIGEFSVTEVLERAEAQVLENQAMLAEVAEYNNSHTLNVIGGRGASIRRRDRMGEILMHYDLDETNDATSPMAHWPNHTEDISSPAPTASIRSTGRDDQAPTNDSIVTLEISDGDDDDDVIFVCQSVRREPIVVDLCDSLPTSPAETVSANSPAPAPIAAPAPAAVSTNAVDNAVFGNTSGSIAEAEAAIQSSMFQMHQEGATEMLHRYLLTRRSARDENERRIEEHRWRALANAEREVLQQRREVAAEAARTAESRLAAADALAAANAVKRNTKPLKCAVCLESPLGNNPSSTTCGHVFCAECIRQALQATKKCPLCNRKLSARQVHLLYL